ncbi:MAG TPA: ATP-binding protein [Streptomyces sp.]
MSGLTEKRVLDVPFRPEAVSQARADARKALADWGRADLTDQIILIVSELVTNALRHGAPDITLTLCLRRDQIDGQVQDRGDGWPVMADPEQDEEHGRGLELVDAIADRWGVRAPHDKFGGKIVWFSLTTPVVPS